MMKRFLFAILFVIGAFAQIPTDTVTGTLAQRLSPRRAFLAAHPGAREIRRLEDAVHFDNGDGTGTALLQGGIAFVDPDSGEITPTDMDLVQTEAGYRTVGSPIVVRVVDGPLVGGNPTSIVQTFRKDPVDKTVAGYAIVTAPLTYQSGFRFTFQQQGLPWTLEVREFGWDLQATVAASQGAKTYRFGYAETNMTLAPDAAGNLSIPSGRYKITRALMLRADGVVTPCSSWLVDRAGVRVGFTCDDSGFPAEAYPYVIDPNGTFTATAADYYGSYAAGTQYTSSTPNCTPSYPSAPTALTNTTAGYGRIADATYYRSDGSGCASQRTTWNLFVRFNTAAIGASNTVQAATLNYYVDAWNQDTTLYNTSADSTTYNVNWDTLTPSWPPAFANMIVASNSPASRSGNAIDRLTTRNTGWISAGIANLGVVINRSGYTYLRASINGRADLNAARNGLDSYYGPHVLMQNGYWPYLAITYTSATGAPSIISATPNSGTLLAGVWTTWTMQVSDPNGYGNLNLYHMQLSPGPPGAPSNWDANSCFFYVRPNANVLALKDDANATWLGEGWGFGTAHVVENSQCKLDFAQSTLTNTGLTSTVGLRVMLKPTFTNGGMVKRTWAYVADINGNTAGWSDMGAWTFSPGGPKLIVVTGQ